ncbi:MAG: hypothetical protein OEY34_00740, partial [Cyclobacteriaceae bacterium]|nr:hypothetical protein [Cyclobacteriaceae bacterium]
SKGFEDAKNGKDKPDYAFLHSARGIAYAEGYDSHGEQSKEDKKALKKRQTDFVMDATKNGHDMYLASQIARGEWQQAGITMREEGISREEAMDIASQTVGSKLFSMEEMEGGQMEMLESAGIPFPADFNLTPSDIDKIEEFSDNNNVAGALKEVAKLIGEGEIAKDFQKILDEHHEAGSLTPEIKVKRDKLKEKLFKIAEQVMSKEDLEKIKSAL